MILGLDTSTSELTVATALAGQVAAERSLAADQTGRPRHAQELLPAIEAVVDVAGGWPEIERIAVGVGPGTFTGLRIGIATARALAQARALPIVAVSSLEALAAGVKPSTSPGRPRLALIDAKRGEVFGALFGDDGTRLWDDAVHQPGALAGLLTELDTAAFAIGDGAQRFRDEVVGAGALVPYDDDPAHRVMASAVCGIGERNGPSGLERIQPNYLRRPDAEVWRERAVSD